jgi:hypothetical protein
VPAALLLAFGLRALAPARWRPGWLPAWLGCWTIFAGAALVRLAGYYG